MRCYCADWQPRIGGYRLPYFTIPSPVNIPSSQGRRPPEDAAKSGFRPADASGIAVPSRLLLLEFLAECKGPVTLKQIRDRFDLPLKAAGNAVAARLERMGVQGLVLKDRKGRYALPQKMDIVPGRVSGHANGYGFVIPDDGSGDLFLHHREMRKVLHGDRVLTRLKRIDERGRKEGAVIEVMVDPAREIVGHFHLESGVGFVEPDDSRYARDITIPGEGRNGAKDGDIVVATVIRHPVEHRHAVGEIVEVMGKQLQAGMETDIAIRKHGIPARWPAEVAAQLEKMRDTLQSVNPKKSPDEKDRHDLRALPLVTIDGEDARDFDDAVYCEPEGDGWRLVVAIADVSYYVRAGTALDREARKRGNSVYFPNRVVPMLPEQLSNGICSLNPGEDRYCMICDIRLDARGEISRYQFYPAVMHSKARLTYTAVNEILSRTRSADVPNQVSKAAQAVAPHLDNLDALTRLLLARRRERGTIDFEFPEARIQFDENQKISSISVNQRNRAHRLIEACMLTANLCAARHLQKNFGSRAIYRNHLGPTDESLVELRRFLAGMGLNINLTLGGGDQPVAADYARLVEAVAPKKDGAEKDAQKKDAPKKDSVEKDIAPVVQMLLLRSLSQAVYGTEQAGHFALAYPIYTHFTSPIRRYSDLVVHRQIRQLIDGKQEAAGELAASDDADKSSPNSFEKIAEQCSFTERRADDASRDVVAWLKAEFMQDKIGAQFDGVISGVKEFGVFVQLDDIFIDGLVHVTGLGDDYYHFDPMRFQLVGERTGRRFRLGDRLRITVARVSLDDAKIDFELCGGGEGKLKPQATKAAKAAKVAKGKKQRSQKHRGKKTGKRGGKFSR